MRVRYPNQPVKPVNQKPVKPAKPVNKPGRPAPPTPAQTIRRVLRALGVLRQQVARPVVGPKAYVRLWQRLRALIVLVALVVGLGVALAAGIGALFIGLAFLLESAIS